MKEIVVINKAHVLVGQEKKIAAIAKACNFQLSKQFCPTWGLVPWGVRFVSDENQAPSDAYRMYLFDDADQAGALGYHDETSAGVPYGKVFAKTIMKYGGTLADGPRSVSMTLSHEVLEMRADLYCDYWAQRANGDLIALETADPVEADAYYVPADGMVVSVSNFVTPRYFDKEMRTGPFDWLGRLHAPFTMTPGGYLIVMKGGKTSQEFAAEGPDYPEWKHTMKASRLARTGRRIK